MSEYDYVVIGSGGGLKFALAAAAAGRRVALIESFKTGGTCLNRGCIPSKLMIYPADVLELFRRAETLNITGSSPGSIRFDALTGRIEETTDGISRMLTERIQRHPNIDLYQGFGRFVGSRILEVDGKHLTAPCIILATGSSPKIPPVDGLADVSFMTSEDALRRRALPKRLIIIGAGYIACELGHAYRSFGCETHFVVRSDLLRHEDDQVRTVFKEAFEKRHVIHRPYVPQSVSCDAHGVITLTMRHVTDQAVRTLEADALLVATGVVPQTAGMGLETTGIQCDKAGYILVDEHFETSEPGVYAMGDCVGNYLFRHSVNREAEYLIDRLIHGAARTFSYGPMPHAVFTIPEIAGAGLTGQQAIQAGHDVVIGFADLPDSNMGMARQLDCGFCKLIVCRKTRKILGVHMIGEDVATLVQIPLTVMYSGGTLDQLLDPVYIHPAYPEVVRDAARDAERKMPAQPV